MSCLFFILSLLLAETYGQQILYAYPWVNMCRCVVAHKQINAYTFFKNCLCAYMYWRNAMFIGWNNITICCNIIFTAQREREKNVCIYICIYTSIYMQHMHVKSLKHAQTQVQMYYAHIYIKIQCIASQVESCNKSKYVPFSNLT